MSDPITRTIEEIRAEIDVIDSDLVRLLSRRAECAIEVGYVKGRDSKPFFNPERERQIYEELSRINPGPLTNPQLIGIFREIISAARAAEKPLAIAYWGPEGTFSNVAALQTFGVSANYLPVDSIHDVFMAVEHGQANYGVVPVENSVAGVVPETLDMFPQTNVRICSELFIPVHHHLLSHAPSLSDVKRVYSGPQPSGQCRNWLRTSLPGVEVIEVVPTATAVIKAMKDPEGAAIGNRVASETYGLPILVEHIEDNPQNRTRFLVIGFNEPAKTGRDKTSMMFNLRNKPGELYRALGVFVAHEVNLQMIESRPAQRASFEYMFFIDCEGHQKDPGLQKVIEALKGGITLETTVLGSYPAAE